MPGFDWIASNKDFNPSFTPFIPSLMTFIPSLMPFTPSLFLARSSATIPGRSCIALATFISLLFYTITYTINYIRSHYKLLKALSNFIQYIAQIVRQQSLIAPPAYLYKIRPF